MQISSDTLLWGASTSLSASLDMKFLLQNLSTVTPKDGLTFHHTFPSHQSSSRYATYTTGQNDFSVGGGNSLCPFAFSYRDVDFAFVSTYFALLLRTIMLTNRFFPLSILG